MRVSPVIPVCLVAAILFSACATAGPALAGMVEPVPLGSAETLASEAGGTRVSVCVDPRFELTLLVEYLAGYNTLFGRQTHGVWDGDWEYTRDIETTFGAFRSHPTVTLFKQMATGRARGEVLLHSPFHTDAPFHVIRYWDCNLVPREDFPSVRGEVSVNRAGGPLGLRVWLEALRRFARDVDFPAFFEAHRSRYRQWMAPAVELAAQGVVRLERFFGYCLEGDYQLVYSPLAGPFGVALQESSGTSTANLGFFGTFGMSETGDPQVLVDEHSRYCAMHELCHHFVAAALPQDEKVIAGLAAALGRVTKSSTYQGPGLVDEYVTRACMLAVLLEDDPVLGMRFLVNDEAAGFAVAPLTTMLMLYDRKRDLYPSFHSLSLADVIASAVR